MVSNKGPKQVCCQVGSPLMAINRAKGEELKLSHVTLCAKC